MRMETAWSNGSDPQGRATSEFVIVPQDERKVTGAIWNRESENANQENVMIAFGHGASGDRYQMPIPYLASTLANMGFMCVSLDGPVHGLRQRGVGGRTALADEMRSPSMFDDMVRDWTTAIDEVETTHNITTERFAYFGLSMGSIFGIPLLAERLRHDLPVTAATLGLLGVTGAIAAHARRILADAKHIECPLLFLMQLEDELFPRDGYLELFDTFESKDKQLHANPGLHPEVPNIEIQHAVNFLVHHLEQTHR